MNELRLPDLFDLDPFERPLRSFLRPWTPQAAEVAPKIRVDVSEDDKAYTVKAEVPGVAKEDIDIRIDGNQLTLSAEVKRDKEEKEGSRLVRSERSYGYSSRSFTLSSAVDEDKADAKYKDGVLYLTLPKRAQASEKRLAIS